MKMDRWGIDEGYRDAMGGWHETSDATRRAILTAMEVDATSAGQAEETPVYVTQPGQTMALDRPAELRLEDDTVLWVNTALPPDLPLGYHDLCPLEGGLMARLVVA